MSKPLQYVAIAIATSILATAILTIFLIPSKTTYVKVEVEKSSPLTHRQEVWLGYVIQKLINCESGGRNVTIVDTNGLKSKGILQFQQPTWADFSQQSGIVGTPTDPERAIEMAKWAIINGYEERWTCWKSVPKEMRQMP